MRRATRRWLVAGGVVVILVLLAIVLNWPQHERQSGREAYDRAQLGTPETEVLAAITMPSSPHAISGLARQPLDLMAEDGIAHFANTEVVPEDRPDGAVLYRREADGQVVGWARWWDTPWSSVVVIFGPDGKVIGRTLYVDRGHRSFWER